MKLKIKYRLTAWAVRWMDRYIKYMKIIFGHIDFLEPYHKNAIIKLLHGNQGGYIHVSSTILHDIAQYAFKRNHKKVYKTLRMRKKLATESPSLNLSYDDGAIIYKFVDSSNDVQIWGRFSIDEIPPHWVYILNEIYNTYVTVKTPSTYSNNMDIAEFTPEHYRILKSWAERNLSVHRSCLKDAIDYVNSHKHISPYSFCGEPITDKISFKDRGGVYMHANPSRLAALISNNYKWGLFGEIKFIRNRILYERSLLDCTYEKDNKSYTVNPWMLFFEKIYDLCSE